HGSSLEKLKNTLKRIKELTNQVSKLQDLKVSILQDLIKILNATYIAKTYENLMKELNTLMKDLDLLYLLELENQLQTAINDHNLKEISYDDFGKLTYVNRGGSGNIYRTSCKSLENKEIALKEIYIEDNEKDIKKFFNEVCAIM
ncbi:33610_t:CDS:1, partial [Racocetra persica]